MKSPYRLPAIGLTHTQSAELDGFHAGRHDFDRIGWCKYLYRTPAEVEAWLAGWRRGQAELWNQPCEENHEPTKRKPETARRAARLLPRHVA